MFLGKNWKFQNQNAKFYFIGMKLKTIVKIEKKWNNQNKFRNEIDTNFFLRNGQLFHGGGPELHVLEQRRHQLHRHSPLPHR